MKKNKGNKKETNNRKYYRKNKSEKKTKENLKERRKKLKIIK